MPPNLRGLNIIHSPPQSTDSQDLIGQPYPDLAAQLDLWSSLTFDSDEPPVTKPDDKSVDEDEDTRSPSLGTPEAAIRDGHVNVVTGTNVGTNQHASRPGLLQQQPQPQLDLSSILAGFGIDPFASSQPPAAIAPSLAQLLTLQGANFVSRQSTRGPIQQQHRAPEKVPQASSADDSHPPAKRARSRRTSEILAASSDGAATPVQTSMLAAEDKRRRNTAASARFRMKKKEREAALEGKAKELETRVNELERECEALRRENGWLKGLVIGVTGAAQAPVVNTTQLSTTTTTGKRARDEVGGP